MSKKRPLNPDDISRWLSEDVNRGKGLIAETFCGFAVVPGNKPVDRLINLVESTNASFDLLDKKFKKIMSNHIKERPHTLNEWVELIDDSSQCRGLKEKLKGMIAEAYGPDGMEDEEGMDGIDDLDDMEGYEEEEDEYEGGGEQGYNPESSAELRGQLDMPEQGTESEVEGGGGQPRFIVITARGAKIPVYELGASAVGSRVIYLALSPPGKHKGWIRGDFGGRGGDWRNRPKSWRLGRMSGKGNGKFYVQKYNHIITINPENIVKIVDTNSCMPVYDMTHDRTKYNKKDSMQNLLSILSR